MLNTRIKTIAIMLTALLTGCGVSSADNSKDCSPGPFLSINAPTLQVSTVTIIPTVLQTSTSFYSTTNINTGVTTSTVTAGPTGASGDGIFTLANWTTSTRDPLVGAVATLPAGTILLASGLPALPITATSLASLVGLTSADFGVWTITNALASPLPANSVITYSAFAGGTLMTATMPTTGTKTYTGKMTGVLANTPVGGSDDVSGNVILNIDFGANTISGTIGSVPGITTTAGASTITPCVFPAAAAACTYNVYAPLSYAPFFLPLPVPFGDITVTGTISGNSFSAIVTTPSITGPTTQTMKGNFYGATANEIAGTFTINNIPSGALGPALILIGSFGAK